MKYLCIVYAGTGPDDPAEEIALKDACIEDDNALFQAGKLIMASPLQGPETAVTLRASGRTDGPYAETKEVVAGFMVIEAPDMEGAIAIVAPGPLDGFASFEIRPILDERHSRTGQDRSALFKRA